MQNTLTKENIYKSFLTGAKYVITEKDSLNAINVFPVADGDTGSNLASLMKSIIFKAKIEPTLADTLKSISNAAIFGARGNSGIIFASYIDGFSTYINKDSIDIDTFVRSTENASKSAYAAIEIPVEGTMITLMRLWHQHLSELKRNFSDIISLLERAFSYLKKDLDNTLELLPILKENKVVDAGAKGFYHFLDGFIHGLKAEEIVVEIKETIDVDLHVDSFSEDQTRYCTELLMEGKNLNSSSIKALLHPYGDSLVVAGNKELVRVHIHTNDPSKIFELAENIGQVIDQKVDDMKRQFEVVNKRKHSIALVTDSIADLANGYEEINQIHVLNLPLFINHVTYFDKLTIKNERFYQMMNDLKEYPKSSQPNPKTIENLYSFLTTYYDSIIVISVSSKMSGTYQAFVQGAKAFSNSKITVIDSLQNSVAEGLLVTKAMEMIAANMEHEAIVSSINKLKENTKILVSVKTLKYMIRSGRLKKTTGFVGNLLNLKPIISIDSDGMGIIHDKAFSLKKSNRLIFEHIKTVHESGGIESYALVHINAPSRAAEYAKELESITNIKPLYISEISTIVAMNAGIGSVAVAYIRKDK